MCARSSHPVLTHRTACTFLLAPSQPAAIQSSARSWQPENKRVPQTKAARACILRSNMCVCLPTQSLLERLPHLCVWTLHLSAACGLHEDRKHSRVSSLKTCLELCRHCVTYHRFHPFPLLWCREGTCKPGKAEGSLECSLTTEPWDPGIPLAELSREIPHSPVPFSLSLGDLRSREPPSDYNCSK